MLKELKVIASGQKGKGLPNGSAGKESTCNAVDRSSILGSGRSPGGGNSNPLQYSCPENTMDRGARWATIQRVANNQTRLRTEVKKKKKKKRESRGKCTRQSEPSRIQAKTKGGNCGGR